MYIFEELVFLPLAALLCVVSVLVQSHQGRQSEVCNLQVTTRPGVLEKNVLQLEISMHCKNVCMYVYICMCAYCMYVCLMG